MQSRPKIDAAPPRESQGNRVKDSFLDEACKEVAVRCGGLTLATHGAFRGGVSHQLARPVFYRRKVGGSAILADAAFGVSIGSTCSPNLFGCGVFGAITAADLSRFLMRLSS